MLRQGEVGRLSWGRHSLMGGAHEGTQARQGEWRCDAVGVVEEWQKHERGGKYRMRPGTGRVNRDEVIS